MTIAMRTTWIVLGILLCISALVLPQSSYAWKGDKWDKITRSTIESKANQMIKSKWKPRKTIKNFGYGSTYHTFSSKKTYTGMAYSQNNPQENWSEFWKRIKNTNGGTTGYGSDCSGFVSMAWKLPKRYTTTTFEYDATHKKGYVYSLGAVGGGSKAKLKLGDALNRGGSHIILFKKRTSGGIIAMEQTPWTARTRKWTWAQLKKYRPIRRYNIKSAKPGAIIGTVTTNGGNLNVRSGPNSKTVVDSLANGAKVTIQCRASGKSVKGKLGTTNQWYRIGTKKYVSAAYMKASKSVSVCK